MDQLLFTPSAVLGLLTQVEELKDKQITLIEDTDTSLKVSIGSTEYTIDSSQAEVVDVPEESFEAVAEVNDDGYAGLEEDGIELGSAVEVEGGIIKELAKTLLIGGMVRLTNKLNSRDSFDAYADQAKKYKR